LQTENIAAYSGTEKTLVALSATLGYCLDFYNIMIMAFMFSAIEHALSITLAQAGLVISMTLAASVLGGVLIGFLGDKIGRKNALLASLILIAIGAILSAFAWNFASLLIFRIFAGIGIGGEWGAGIVLFNEVWDRRRRGLGSGIIQAMSAVGLALASVVSAYCLTHYEADLAWRIAMAIGGLPILLAVLVRTSMPESKLWAAYKARERRGELPPAKIGEAGPLLGTFQVASGKYFILGTIIAGGYIMSYQSGTTFMPTLMGRVLGAGPEAIRNAVLLWAAFVAVANALTGHLSDRYGRKRLVVGSAAVVAVGFVAIFLAGDIRYPGSILTWPVFWVYVLWGVGQGGSAVFGPWYAELYPVEYRATAVSTIYTTGRLIGSSAPYVVPALAAAFGSLVDAMMFGLFGCLVGLFGALLLPETAGRKFAVVEDWTQKPAST